VHSSLRCNQGERLVRLCARTSVSHRQGHTVRTQHGVTARAGQQRGNVEIRNYLQDQAGRLSLVFDLSTESRTTSSAQAVPTCIRMVCYSIPKTSIHLCVLLSCASSIDIGNNTMTIRTFLFSPPLSAQAHACTANLRLLFLQAHGRPRHTTLPLECHCNNWLSCLHSTGMWCSPCQWLSGETVKTLLEEAVNAGAETAKTLLEAADNAC